MNKVYLPERQGALVFKSCSTFLVVIAVETFIYCLLNQVDPVSGEPFSQTFIAIFAAPTVSGAFFAIK